MGSANGRTTIDVESSEKHALLGTGWNWEEGSPILESIETALDSAFAAAHPSAAGLKLSSLCTRFVAQPIDAPLSLKLFCQPLKPCIAGSETFNTWALQRNGGILAIHEPIDPVGTAVSILSNPLTGTTKSTRINQFFEFRHWDCRYNSIDSMLSQFLVELSRFHSQSGSILDNYQYALHHNIWSTRSLLSAIQEFLLFQEEQEEDAPKIITWVLVDLDEKIKSSQWLLSTISDLISSSEFNFKVVIVNRYYVDLGNITKGLAVIAPSGNYAPKTRCEDSCDNALPPAKTGDSALLAGRREERHAVIWELIAESPNLYESREQVSAILDGYGTETALLETVETTLKLMARNLTPADLREKLTQMTSMSIETLFQLLWMPSFFLPYRKVHIGVATDMLFYAARGLCIEEIRDLENRTSYGQSIGIPSYPDKLQHHVTHTVSLLPGLVSVTQNEVHFSHPRFREILSQTSPFNDEKKSQLAHSCIAAWCLERITKATTGEFKSLSIGGAAFAANLLHHDFMSYAIRYWAKHVKLAGPEAEKSDSLQIILKNRPLLLRWAQAFWNMSRSAASDDLAITTPLAIFAQHGLESLMVTYMNNYHHTPTYQHEYSQALRQAVQSGEPSIVKALLNDSTIPKIDTFDDILLDAFATGNEEVTQELIEATKRQPDGLSDPVRVLEGAAYYGNSEAVKLLITELLPETLKGNGSSITLMAVAGSRLQETGTLEVMKLLLDAGFGTAEFSENDENTNALVAAARLGNPHLATLLAKRLADTVEAEILAGKGIDKEEKSLWDLFQAALSAAAQNQHHQVIQSLLDIICSKGWREPPDMIPELLESTFVINPMCTSVLLAHCTRPGIAEHYEAGATELIGAACEHNDVSAARALMNTFGDPDPDQILRLFKDCAFGGDDQLDIIRFLDEKASQAVLGEDYTKALNVAFGRAVGRKSVATMRYLFQKKPDLNWKSGNRETHLHWAAWQGHTEIAQILLDAGADPNLRNFRHEVPLHGAYDNSGMLEVLLLAGADVNAETSDGETALLRATRYGYEESILVLLEHHAEVNIQVGRETILTNVVVSGNYDLTTKLLEAGANPLAFSTNSVDNPLLHTCVRDNAYDILKALLVYDVPINDFDADGNKALSCISRRTSVPILKLLVGRGATVGPDDGPVGEALHNAIRNSNTDVICYLASLLKDIDFRIGLDGSILHMACERCDLDTVKSLVTMHCDVNSSDPGVNGLPLQAALLRSESEEKDEIIEYLLNLEEIDMEQSSQRWGGYLSPACLCAGFQVAADLIEKRRSPLSIKDKMGRLPIHFALCRSIKFVELLCDNGADLHARDQMRRTGPHFAVISGDLSLVKYVLGSDNSLVDVADADNWTPLLWALRICGFWNTKGEERAEIIKELLSRGANKLVKGEGLDRTWTAFELSHYYSLAPHIIELVTPTPIELEKLDVTEREFWNYTIESRTSNATRYAGYCDACLMVCVRY